MDGINGVFVVQEGNPLCNHNWIVDQKDYIPSNYLRIAFNPFVVKYRECQLCHELQELRILKKDGVLVVPE